MGGDKQPRANNKFFRKLNRFSFNFIEGKINFHEKPNSTYNDKEMLQTLLFLSIKNRYPENGCKRCKEIVEKSPDADTFYIINIIQLTHFIFFLIYTTPTATTAAKKIMTNIP